MGGLPDSNELLEIFGCELATIIANDAGMVLWMCLPGALENNLRISLLHLFADIPGHYGARASIEY